MFTAYVSEIYKYVESTSTVTLVVAATDKLPPSGNTINTIGNAAIAVDANLDVYFAASPPANDASDGEALYKYSSSSCSTSDTSICRAISTGSVTLLMNQPNSCLKGVAVDSSLNVYVGDNCLDHVYKYDASTGTTQNIEQYTVKPTSLAVDSNNNLYIGTSDDGVQMIDGSTGDQSTILSGGEPRGVAVDSDYLYVADSSDATIVKYTKDSLVETNVVSSTYLSTTDWVAIDSSSNLYAGDALKKFYASSDYTTSASTGVAGYLQAYDAANSIGWFMCEDEVQSSFPATTADGLGACSLNGVSWKREMGTMETSSSYFWTSAEALTNAISIVNETSCAAEPLENIIDTVCDYIHELPPYSCSKEAHSHAYDILGTAAANAELFYVIITGLLVRLLEFVQKYARGSTSSKKKRGGRKSTFLGDEVHPSIGDEEAPSSVGKGEAAATGTSFDTKKPMHLESEVSERVREAVEARLAPLEAELRELRLQLSEGAAEVRVKEEEEVARQSALSVAAKGKI